MDHLTIVSRPVAELAPYPKTARTHSKKQIQQIAASIECFGWTNPVLVDADGRIVAGHGRVAAAKLLGIEQVPTIALEDLTKAQVRAYVLADNKLAENAGWDREILAIELQALVDLDFDVELTGFETAEVDLLIEGLEAPGSENAADRLPAPAVGPAVSRPGDLWRLGRHRLLCGDATRPEAYARLLAGEKAQMVFTDPPYNVPVDGHVCGLGAVRHGDFAMASGEMSEAQFTAFLEEIFSHLAASSQDGAIHFVCMDWRHLFEVMVAGRAVYSELKNLCVWNKTNGGMGSLYRSKHELILVFKNGTAPHINTVELGRHGRYRTNVWDYAGINSFTEGRLDQLAMHPTVKPVALVADAIKDCSRHGGVVLDAFGGSGTTLIAAERIGRRGRLIELDPAYVDTAIARFEELTGEVAMHAETGLGFVDLRAWRSIEGEEATSGEKETEDA
ncbi:site-specific DNA-methyltransferase [Pelagibius sp.]|uniref:site-specific DNA-methyltransferase n=1 Tax=Pelagibius sp. TaxID=1931238 RepID=UPI003B5051BA